MSAFVMPAIHGTLSHLRPLEVTLAGDLDISNREKTRRQLQPLVFSRYGIVDLRSASIGDATCLGDLAAARRANAARGGTIVLVVSSPTMRRILSMVRFDALFPIVASVGEAYNEIALRETASA